MTRFWQRCEGNTAVEFALIAPAFVAMLIGSLYAAMLGFSYINLQYAAEDAARCAAVKTSVCGSAAATEIYAQGDYSGMSTTPTFTWAAAACGSQVKATATYTLQAYFVTVAVPLSVTACYPT